MRGAGHCLLGALLLSGLARADDRLQLDGLIDLRLVHTDAAPSYLYGGLGPVRFDDDHDGLRLGRASLALRARISETVTATAVIDAYDDGDINGAGVSEAFVQWRPFPSNSVRWQLKAGAFYLPVSLEHRLLGWSSPYTLSASAVNTWVGEEFRVLGAELEARWLGGAHGYHGDIALVGGVYGWDEGAGAVIAQRGWALTDRPSFAFGALGEARPGLYYQFDGHPGAYGGISWRHHERLEVRALHYDNRADPAASNLEGYAGWNTRFNALGARWEPIDLLTFAAQYLDGRTAVGPNGSPTQLLMDLSAWYGLASIEFGRNRFSVRYDRFATLQTSGFYGAPSDEAGHALTVALLHRLAEQWELAAEWLRVESQFPPRASFGQAVASTDTQVQLAIRYRFRFEPL
jgi:hypothetical protein